MKIDFSQVKGPEPLPSDDYESVMSDYSVVESAKSSGKPYANVQYTVTAEGEYKNRKLFRNYSLQPQSLWAFKQMATRLGADPDDLTGEVEIEEILASLVGAPCVVSVGIREWEGQERNEVKDVKPSATAVAGFR